jgi:hypothetical protein
MSKPPFPGNKKPRPRPGFFASHGIVGSLISSAKNTRPEPVATATVATADVFAGQSVHERDNLIYQTGGNMTKGIMHVKLKFR